MHNIPQETFYLYEKNYKVECIKNNDIGFLGKVIKENGLEQICSKYKVKKEEMLKGVYPAKPQYQKKIENLLTQYLDTDIDNIELPEEYNSKKDMLFEPFFTPLIKAGVARLDKYAKYINKKVKISFIETLFSNLASCSVRTLIFEMNVCKQAGDLKGANSEEEYQYYNSFYLSNSEYRKNLFNEYPVLLRIVSEKIECCIKNYTTFLSRFESDHSVIANKLCQKKDFTSIDKINGQMSDAHHGGETVFQILLDNGYTILYKPHQVANEKKYLQIYDWCADKCDSSIYRYKIIDKGNYGWVEYVEQLECVNEKEIENYFYRFGIQAFILFILGAGDIHYENLIAHGEYPVIVDCETMLENMEIDYNSNAYVCVSNYLNQSVLHSGLFPYFTWRNKEFGVDFSALSGIEEQRVPIRLPKIVNEKTSEMKMVYDYPTVTGKGNIVMCQNKKINPSDYTTFIMEGFKSIYGYVMDNINIVKTFLQSINLEEVTSRQLMKNTQRYAILMSTSYHPVLLSDGVRRELLLSKSLEDIKLDNKKDIFVANAEIKEMLQNDVPYFYSKPDSKDLYSISGEVFTGYYDSTSLQKLEEKISKLSEKDLTLQLEFIKDTLMLANQEQKKSVYLEQLENKLKNIECKFLINEKEVKRGVKKIAANISNMAFYNASGNQVSWIAATRDGYDSKIHWRFFPISYFLYEGLAGLALFFSILKKCEISKEYIGVFDAIVDSLFEYTDKYAKDNIDNAWTEIGAFSGEASVVYTYLFLYKYLNEEKYLKYGIKHAFLLERCIENDINFDILSGSAGAIHVLCKLYEITKDKKIIAIAEKVSNYLLSKAEKQQIGIGWSNSEFPHALAGFAHGNAGIAYVLMEIWKITGNQEYLNAATDAIEYENSLLDLKDNNWKDIRIVDGVENDKKGIRPIAWCHGASGILLSRLEMLKICPSEMRDKILLDIEKAAETVIRGGVFKDYCLCHGTLGNLLILSEYNKLKNSESLETAINLMINKISKEIADGIYESPQNNSPFFNGFMLGNSGMGYALMRSLDSSIPNILALEI